MFYSIFKKEVFQNPLNHKEGNKILSDACGIDCGEIEYEEEEREEKRKKIIERLKKIGEYRLAQFYEKEDDYDKFSYRVRKELGI